LVPPCSDSQPPFWRSVSWTSKLHYICPSSAPCTARHLPSQRQTSHRLAPDKSSGPEFLILPSTSYFYSCSVISHETRPVSRCRFQGEEVKRENRAMSLLMRAILSSIRGAVHRSRPPTRRHCVLDMYDDIPEPLEKPHRRRKQGQGMREPTSGGGHLECIRLVSSPVRHRTLKLRHSTLSAAPESHTASELAGV
jgi:hypothetical protein